VVFDNWPIAIALTSIGLRLSQIPLYWLLKRIKLPSPTFLNKWQYNIFINDLLIDARRRNLTNYKKNRLLSFYEPARLLSWCYQVFNFYPDFFINE
jgi:hypothetical protein